MIEILIVNESPETKFFLMKCLEATGFTVIEIKNGFVRAHLTEKELSNIEESKKSGNISSIFPSIPRLYKVFEFIELNYRRPISLKEVAQAVGYSSAYLTNLVRRLTGKTVNDWIILRRITEACSLLLRTNESVNQIALQVGYQNINHFYSQFRDCHGTTPHAWRKAQRSKLSRSKKM
ncbi:helix-turn-helix domain-containing protein [Scytonema sp. UIC 10036]|uniref:helix-turn-helix domain-containing protein n=1 Tax=Scytonema sp. UIC 10036 TaxID=2304196 RepID=UPI0012DAB5B0|nr:AraC family transcriptional regulator [Scytonema sp. UIC 10036]MUG98278.1 helix-turn-helix domain-containing protein [Scytonema sp. UIC 10036]